MLQYSEDIRKDKDFLESKRYAEDLKQKYDLDLVRLFEYLGEKEVLIPLSIFNSKLSALETVCRYMHDNLGIGFKRIGGLLSRSEKTVWQAYNHSLRKYKKTLKPGKGEYVIPVSALSDRKLSNLEAIVSYVKERYGLKFSEISVLLHRDQRTVWTVYNRARKKCGKD